MLPVSSFVSFYQLITDLKVLCSTYSLIYGPLAIMAHALILRNFAT